MNAPPDLAERVNSYTRRDALLTELEPLFKRGESRGTMTREEVRQLWENLLYETALAATETDVFLALSDDAQWQAVAGVQPFVVDPRIETFLQFVIGNEQLDNRV